MLPIRSGSGASIRTVRGLVGMLRIANTSELASKQVIRWCGVLLAIASIGCGHPRSTNVSQFGHDGSVILITIDTLRADRVGVYGSTRGLTPNIDALEETPGRTVVFRNAIAQSPLTVPSHATILTGLHPARHGIRTNDGFRLKPDVRTLAEAFQSTGYVTAAFIGGYPLRRATGLDRGFHQYEDHVLSSVNELRAADVVRLASAWIRERRHVRSTSGDPYRPSFAWIHLFDPHTPYEAPLEYARAGRHPYDAEVAYTDAMLGRLFDELRAADILDRVLLIIVADHGESLGDHGERTHGTFVYDATIRVPLIVRFPEGSGRAAVSTIAAPVETADIAPTLAAIAGLRMNGRLDGTDLRPLLNGQAVSRDTVYSETYYQHVLLGWSPLRALRGPEWKFIEAPASELYDLQRDPGETINVINDRPSVARAMATRLPARGEVVANAAPTPESAERLRSLGYVTGRTDTRAARGRDPKDGITTWNAIEEGVDAMERDPQAARIAFARALTLDPSNGLAMKYAADVAFGASEWRDAARGYRRAIAAGFRHPDVYINLASLAAREGRRDEARNALAEAVKLAPADADAWNRLGLLEMERGNADAARRAFAAAVGADQGLAEGHYNLGVAERATGNHSAAATHFRAAIARKSGYAEAHYELATVLLAAREPARALEEYRAALASRPEYPEALFGAARAELELGLRDEARRHYQEFIRVAPRAYEWQISAARQALKKLAGGS